MQALVCNTKTLTKVKSARTSHIWVSVQCSIFESFTLNLLFLYTFFFYSGKRGLYTISSGIKIAYVSGIDAEKSDWSFDTEDVKAVRNSCFINKTSMGEYRGIDILLTSQWPFGIDDTDTKTDKSGSNDAASKLLSWLAREIKPRYHFAGLNGKYYERLPYRFVCYTQNESEIVKIS